MASLNTVFEQLTSEHLFAWIKAGLLHFQLKSLKNSNETLAHYEKMISQALSGSADMSWKEINAVLGQSMAQSDTGLSQLVKDEKQDLPQFFLFALCSGIELRRSLAQVVGKIQNNPQPGWLELGFASEIVRFLFSMQTTPDITRWPLLQQNILIVKGQGPQSIRHLYTSADYWNAIASDQILPEFLSLPDTDMVMSEHWKQSATELLRRQNVLALDTDPQTAKALVAILAKRMKLRAVEVDYVDWQQKSLRALMYYAGWLPLVRCTQAEMNHQSDALFIPSVLLVRGDQQLPENGIFMRVPGADIDERKKEWQTWVMDAQAVSVLSGSVLNPAIIQRIGKQILRPEDDDVLQQIRRIRNAEGTSHLKKVAQPVETWVDEEMMILPAETKKVLQQCFQRCLQRDYQQFGMGEAIRATANTGVLLLFSGPSGTGKTLASSWLTSQLGMPLFKIDLALVMNKYIGETEKNLALALDEAARSDAVLLFDEADALFGQRSEGGHSGDRYANMLTNYLLSRIENHPGIVVLTTNAGNRMDTAFQRRIDIAVEFKTMPYEERLRLWQAMLASRNPGTEICQRIARYCELSPGHVRNVVVNACCWFPEQTPLSAAAIYQGLEEEYRKTGRSMPSQLMRLKTQPAADPVKEKQSGHG